MTDGVSYALRDAVALLTLDDAATLNAVTEARADALRAALDRAATEARAIVITGAGRAFSSGYRLPDADGEIDAGWFLERHGNPLMLALRDSPLPIVTAVRGAAAGFGCSLALMGDVIVASQSAYFLQAFRGVGLVPDGAAAFLLSRAIGRTRAMELMLLGERLPAARALEWGLVSRVVTDETLEAVALDLAGNFAAGPASLGLIRRAAWAALETDFAGQLEREVADQRAAGRTADFREGLAAFRAKRAPHFTGD
ncbi:enoyl-CoA hydratase-related protein [Sphingomonas quercus]|uniref:Enoyl-CoA hydratase/isomerase family protein n=1 Tax=Sphingomonas quercus TaxID=2842451 RepID=A0ABS6BE86_9SPHN|nr:enoyl-CoA hydratase-related protein [Sphingomonas quercus]MBU3076474.1 enoyl-CoA hydratase/isomerase family protein [Sphingomonas quercus]